MDTASLTDPEKIGMAEQMAGADMEWATNVGGRMGPVGREHIDPERIRLTGKRGYHYGRQGQYIGDDYVRNATLTPKLREAWKLPDDWRLEEDTVMIMPNGMTDLVQSHEFRHRAVEKEGGEHSSQQHDLIYLLDAWNARTRSEWEESLHDLAEYAGVRYDQMGDERQQEFAQKVLGMLKANSDLLAELEGEAQAKRYGTEAEEETESAKEIAKTRLSAASGTPLDFNEE